MDKAHILWGFLWIFYCFLHSFLANNYVKATAAHYLKMGSNGYRILYNCVALGHLAVLGWFHLTLQSPLLFSRTALTVIPAVLFVLAGLWVMVICVAKYFRQLSGISSAGDKVKLFTGGLHRYVRHPLYLGTFIFLTGFFLYSPFLKNGLVVCIIISYTLIGILLEEKKLLRQFGTTYQQYQQEVPMIIPGLRRRKENKFPRTHFD